MEISPIILDNLKHNNPNCRYTAATTFKFFCTKSVNFEHIQKIVEMLFTLVND